MIKSFLLVMVALILTGCATSNTTKEVVVQTIVIAPDDDMLGNCLLQEPPEPFDYQTSTADEKELMLTRAYTGATGKLITCNARWEKLREWKVKQKAALEKPPENKP